MQKKSIRSLTHADIGSQIIVCGNVTKLRIQKKFTFIELRDGMLSIDTIQCVAATASMQDIKLESYIKIRCEVKAVPNQHNTLKGFELQICEIMHHNESLSDFSERVPLHAGIHIQLQERHLHLRQELPMLYMKLTALTVKCLTQTIESFYGTEIFPPSFGSVKCEGGSEVFEFDHFGTKCFLSQSAQLYLEAVVSRGTVYCIDKSYRAENSLTRRHLTCYQHFEVERPHFDSFEEFLDFLEEFLKRFLENIISQDNGTLHQLGRLETVQQYLKKGFLRIHHSNAIDMLKSQGIVKNDGSDFTHLDDIPEAQERKLIDSIDQIVFLTKMPSITKAFYTLSDPMDKNRTLTCDVEFPGVGEIIGSSLREYDYNVLKDKLKFFTLRDVAENLQTFLSTLGKAEEVEKIKRKIKTLSAEALELEILQQLESINEDDAIVFKKNMVIPYKDYEWYLDLRKYGSPRSGGFGIGVERMVTWLAGANSIKDVTTFPRYPGYTYP